MNWMAMGGYGFFVWSAVGVTLLILMVLHVLAFIELKQQKKNLTRVKKRTVQTQVHVSETKQ